MLQNKGKLNVLLSIFAHVFLNLDIFELGKHLDLNFDCQFKHWSDFQCHSTKSAEVFRIVQLSRIPVLVVVIFPECCQNAEVRRINILSKSISDIENFLSKASDILRTFLSQFLSHALLQVSFIIMKIGSLGGQGQDFYFAAFWACFILSCG